MAQDTALILTAEQAKALPARERVGLALARLDAATLVRTIMAAEEAGVRQVWSTQSLAQPDTLTLFAAAAVQTRTIRLGSAVIPTYPRHPLTMAAQALAINELAPGRLRLGIGSSHRPIIQGTYGIEMVRPLEHLREYVEIVRAILWDGKADLQGQFFTVKATASSTARVPILTSVLRKNAFKLAGEVSDGALSWLCPLPYLLKTGLPAMQAGAQEQGRPVPPLVAHVLVAVSEDRSAAVNATRERIQSYGKLPFYASMFADAGYPVESDGTMSEDLVGDLILSGRAPAIAERLKELQASGLDELLVMPIPVHDAQEELHQLMQLIGGL